MKEINEVKLLRKFKKESGWSYYRLATNIGIHYQTVYSWFARKRSPSHLALEKLQKFLRSIERAKAKEEKS